MPKMTILKVETGGESRIVDLLQAAGIEVLEAATRDEALALAVKKEPEYLLVETAGALEYVEQHEIERAQWERQTALAHQEAAVNARRREDYLAVITHELRSPLNTILGWAQTLRGKKQDPKLMAHALEAIERGAEEQRRLLADLTDMARAAGGVLPVRLYPLDLTQVVREASEEVRLVAEQKGVNLTLALDPQPISILGDAARLQQILRRLLASMIRASAARDEVIVVLLRVGGDVRLTLRSETNALSAEKLVLPLEGVEPVSQADRRTGFLGMILAFARQVVEMHAGSLAVEEASEGHGVSFLFNLPLRASATPTNVSDEALDFAPDLAGLRVLVVDDEADARQLHATMLEQYGAQVLTAASVAEAMRYFTEARPSELPDLIVSDISMPGDDGYSLIRQVRGLSVERGGRVPAIALTGLTQVADRIRVLSAGFQMHLAKPVNAAELALALAMLAGRNGRVSNGGSAANEATFRRVGRVTRASASHAARENRKTTRDLSPPTR